MRDLYNNIRTTNSLNVGTFAATTNGAAVDLKGFDSAVVLITASVPSAAWTAGKFVTFAIEDSATGTGDWLAVADAELQGGAVPAAAKSGTAAQTIERGYLGKKGHLRVTMTANASTDQTGGAVANVTVGHPASAPVVK